jgi:hypothetical protein
MLLLSVLLYVTDLTCDVTGSETGGSMVKGSVPTAGSRQKLSGLSDVKDLEAADGAAAGPTNHYVPFVELFRGHWKGIVLQTGYEACKEDWFDVPINPIDQKTFGG